jgi:hypothetical protein
MVCTQYQTKLNQEAVTLLTGMLHARNISVSKPEEEQEFAWPKRYC